MEPLHPDNLTPGEPPKSQFPHYHFAIFVAIAVSSIFFTLWARAGSLTPSALPGATMETLQEIYDAIAGTFDSSSITASSTGSLIQDVKYMSNSLGIASGSSGFYFSPTSRNVGIGTTAPITQFQVAGKVAASVLASVSFSSLGGYPLDVAIQGNYAYVSTYISNGFTVVDISNKQTPVVLRQITGVGAGAGYLDIQGHYAYKTDASTMLSVIDIANPYSPQVLKNTTVTGAQFEEIAVQGRYAYIVSAGDLKLYVFDVSNPANPTIAGTASLAGDNGSGNGKMGLSVQGRYVYVTNEDNAGAAGSSGGSYLEIFDVADPATPVSIGRYTTSGANAAGIYVQGRYAYVVDPNGSAVSGTLEIVDIKNPASPTNVGSLTLGSQPFDVVVQGRYAYIPNYISKNLQIVDVSDPANPVSVGTVPISFTGAFNIEVQGRYAYVVSQVFGSTASSKFLIFDIGGAYIQQLEAGGIETGTLATRANLQVNNDSDIRGGLVVGRGLQVTGPVAITSSISGYTVSVFNPNGNVGIGNNSPDQKLDVSGIITASSSGNVDFVLRSSTTNGSASVNDAQFTLRTSSTSERFDVINGAGTRLVSVASVGNVGVGTTAPGLLLHVKAATNTDVLRLQDSDGTCDHNPGSGSEVVTCSSDQRLKENIIDAPSALSDLSKFHIREYNVISSHDRMIGVIAQEVQQVFPDLVSSRSNGYLAVEQPSLWQLVKGIQELATRSMTIEEALLNEGSEANNQTILSVLRDTIKDALISVREVIADTFQAKRIRAEKLEFTGDDGMPYCVRVVAGALQSTPGSCEAPSLE